MEEIPDHEFGTTKVLRGVFTRTSTESIAKSRLTMIIVNSLWQELITMTISMKQLVFSWKMASTAEN